MDLSKMSIGSKKPKKEITIDVTPFHYFYFFGALMLIVTVIYFILVLAGIYTIEDMSITCSNGEIEPVEYGKTIYCGEHYTKLKGVVKEKNYNYMELVINGE